MAWTKSSEGGYAVLTESGLVLDDNESASAEIVTVSSVIKSSDYNWENTKFPLTVEITTVSGAAVVVDAIWQVSNGSATTGDVMGATSATPLWSDGAAIDIDIASAAAASYSKLVDASDLYGAYARVALKTAATDLTDGAGICTIKVAFPADNVPLEAADLANGVGADPS